MAEPKIVVWGWFEGNDSWDLSHEMRIPQLRRYLTEPIPLGLKMLQKEVDFVRRKQAAKLEFMAPFQPLIDFFLLDATRNNLGFGIKNHSRNEQLADDIESVIVTARNLIHSWGGRLLLVYLPAPARYCDVVESWRNECDQNFNLIADMDQQYDLISLFERLGVPVVDGHAAFLETGRPGDMFFHPYSHYSPEGYRVIAEAVLREIRPMLHIPVDADRNPSTPKTAPATMFGSY